MFSSLRGPSVGKNLLKSDGTSVVVLKTVNTLRSPPTTLGGGPLHRWSGGSRVHNYGRQLLWEGVPGHLLPTRNTKEPVSHGLYGRSKWYGKTKLHVPNKKEYRWLSVIVPVTGRLVYTPLVNKLPFSILGTSVQCSCRHK